MSKQPHTEFRIGQRVLVFLRNGSQIVAKYKGKYRNGVMLGGQNGNVRVNTDETRQISIYKEQSNDK